MLLIRCSTHGEHLRKKRKQPTKEPVQEKKKQPIKELANREQKQSTTELDQGSEQHLASQSQVALDNLKKRTQDTS